jgi:hypothetical protein
MQENKGFEKDQIREVLLNALIFSIQIFVFYVIEQNKLFAALATMAALFSLYTIPLSKSDIKSTIIGSISVNIIVSIFFITYYINNFNIIFLFIWILISIWFLYKLKEKIKLK